MYFIILNDGGRFPARATMKSCGYDFYSPETFTLKPNECHIIDLGVGIREGKNDPSHWYLSMAVRSSLVRKHRIFPTLTNPKIDQDYKDSITFEITNLGHEDYTVEEGDRIAQGVFNEFLVTDDDLVLSDVRNGGLGSTGK